MAFYAYSDMFSEIADAAKQCSCKFTLYVDDMTFSSKEPFSPDRLRQMIDCILRKYGHKPKYSKVKYYGFSDYKPITGTIVTPEYSRTDSCRTKRSPKDHLHSVSGSKASRWNRGTFRWGCETNSFIKRADTSGPQYWKRKISWDQAIDRPNWGASNG